MNKILVGAALAMGALLAGQQATQPQATIQHIDDMATSIERARQHKPAPTKPAAPAPAQERVTVAARPLPMVTPTRYFIERPYQRKVKYGKRRWVIV